MSYILGNIRKLFAEYLSTPRYSSLPTRVRAAIRSQQQASEILIGWIQLGVLALFASLYAVAPKTFSDQIDFAPVPWALSVYFLFTLFRLVGAHKNLLTNSVLYLSVIVDMFLLYALIWSFHVQYMQPPSFYLKAPSLLYVFIFIALRALRFEARFVIFTGLIAAAGWLLMVWYVIAMDPSDPMITRDYVEYLTSNSVLVGAEVDKVISILVVTAILAISISRGRQLLVRSVIEGTTARDLSRFVPTQVVEQVTHADHRLEAGEAEIKQTTILFVDIEGFTSLSESISPEQLIRTLNEYYAAVAEPIRNHNGVINQFQGDAILATFNLSEHQGDHATNAVKAALDIQKILKDRTFGEGSRLRSRIGINTGTVVGGLVGTPDRLSYTVHGDAVNIAERLEKLNKEYGTRIIVSDDTCELAGRQCFSFKELGEVKIRGRQTQTLIYELPVE